MSCVLFADVAITWPQTTIIVEGLGGGMTDFTILDVKCNAMISTDGRGFPQPNPEECELQYFENTPQDSAMLYLYLLLLL